MALTQVQTGMIADGAITSAKLASGPLTAPGAFNEAASTTLASASTVNIGAASSNTITITGTTSITAFDSIAAGAVRRLIFSAALTLTHNATSLILPSAANITTAAGDSAEFVSLGSGNWKCFTYTKANGQAVVAPASAFAGLGGQAFTSNGTFTIPSGVSAVKVTILGAGGGGGGANSACGSAGGGGGGGGGCAIVYLTGLTSGNTISVTTGTAGTAGSSGGGTGGTGGTSSISSGTQTISTVSATGGGGGQGMTSGSGTSGSGGSGSGGTYNLTGTPGGYTTRSGGSSALFYSQAPSNSANATGFAGSTYGGGGSGAIASGGSAAGGAGAGGLIVFEW